MKMLLENLLPVLLGSSGIGIVISSILTHNSENKKTDVQLLDRAQAEIIRIDEKLKEAERRLTELEMELLSKEKQLLEKDIEIGKLQALVGNLREAVNAARIEMEEVKNGGTFD